LGGVHDESERKEEHTVVVHDESLRNRIFIAVFLKLYETAAR